MKQVMQNSTFSSSYSMWDIASVIGLNVPIAIFSGITLFWSIALLVIDDKRQRYAIRHTLVGIASCLLFIGALFDLNADAVDQWAASSRTGFTVPLVCFMIARAIAWCIYFETLRTTALPGSMHSQSVFFISIIVAYIWTGVMILTSILWSTTFASYGQAGNVDLQAAFIISTFGLLIFLILGIILQRDIILKTPSTLQFRASFGSYALMMVLITAGELPISVFYCNHIYISDTIVLIEYAFSTLMICLALVLACASASIWVWRYDPTQVPVDEPKDRIQKSS